MRSKCCQDCKESEERSICKYMHMFLVMFLCWVSNKVTLRNDCTNQQVTLMTHSKLKAIFFILFPFLPQTLTCLTVLLSYFQQSSSFRISILHFDTYMWAVLIILIGQMKHGLLDWQEIRPSHCYYTPATVLQSTNSNNPLSNFHNNLLILRMAVIYYVPWCKNQAC